MENEVKWYIQIQLRERAHNTWKFTQHETHKDVMNPVTLEA